MNEIFSCIDIIYRIQICMSHQPHSLELSISIIIQYYYIVYSCFIVNVQ